MHWWQSCTPRGRALHMLWLLLMIRTKYTNGSQEASIDAQGRVKMEQLEKDSAVSAPPSTYGAGFSWPMQYAYVEGADTNPLGFQQRQASYDAYMQDCFGEELEWKQDCLQYEKDRIDMNLHQPAASQNYTHAGYAKVETPPVVQKILKKFWEEHRQEAKYELWEYGNSYVNHWQSPTNMVDVSDANFGLSEGEHWDLVQAIQSVLEAWTKQPLVLTSLYGIRVYGPNAVLAPHVDRLPLVSSAIINVAQYLTEDWPLEVIGHDGVARNLTVGPSDMILYESHSVIHGRPFPLQGKFCANLFVHFEPLGHSIRHMESGGYGSDAFKGTEPAIAQASYEEAFERVQKEEEREAAQDEREGDEKEGGTATNAPSPYLPAYVSNDNEVRWRQQFEYEKEAKVTPKPTKDILGHINVHHAAADGMLDMLKDIAKTDRGKLFARDHNGWRPLHEAARGGRAETVEFLLQEGAQVNERTNKGSGGNPLWWAEKDKEANAATIAVLKKHGAVSLAPRTTSNVKIKKAQAPKAEKQ